MTKYLKYAVAGGMIAVVLLAGFLGGRALKPDSDTTYRFDQDAPAYTAPLAVPALSKGGFSGFGAELGLEGATLLSGRVTAISADEITIELSLGTQHTFLLGEIASLSQLEADTVGVLEIGLTVVVVSGDGDDEAAAILIIEEP